MLSPKFLLIGLAIIILGVAIYLNRSYAHIFDYDKSRILISTDMQRSYTLEGGEGQENFKYVALGDSLTYGLGSDSYTKTFPYVIAQKLLNNYKRVEVTNLAVSGAIAQDVLNSQVNEAIKLKPDFVTLMIGTNDVHDFVKKEDFENQLGEIIDRLKTTNARIQVINIPYLGTKSLILPPYDNILDSKIKDYNLSIKNIAEKKQVEYFDLYTSALEPFANNPDYYSSDQFHPSGKGYVFWGDLLSGN